jgi:hypothetical protein
VLLDIRDEKRNRKKFAMKENWTQTWKHDPTREQPPRVKSLWSWFPFGSA